MKIEGRLSDAMHDYADAIEPSADSWDRISARFDDGAPPRRPMPGRLVVAGVAAALVIVLIAVLAIRDDGPTNKVVTGPGASSVTPMPSRILAIEPNGHPVVLNSTTGEQETGLEASIAEGTQIAVSPDGQDAYLVTGDGNEGCADHSVVRLPVGATARGGEQIALEASSPTVSPDGRYLAYLRCLPGDARADEIVLLDLAAGGERTTAAPTGTFFINRLEFAADSHHVLYDLYEDATRRDQIHQLDVVAGAIPPGPVVGPVGWAGVRGVTGEYLQWVPDTEHGLQSGIATWEPSSSTATIRFEVPTPPTQVVSDLSGRHLLAVADGGLYRWSVGDEKPTKLFGNYTGVAWIPDAGKEEDPSPAASLPPGLLASTTDRTVVSMDSTTGQVHETLTTIPRVVSIGAIAPDGLTAIYESGAGTGGCAEPQAEVGTVDLDSGARTRIVSGAVDPVVSPDGRFVAYGIRCDGVTLGFSDLRNGMNYRINPFPSNVRLTRVQAVVPVSWAPDSEHLLYRIVTDGPPGAEVGTAYYVAQLWPPSDTEPTSGSTRPGITAAAFVDSTTLATAEKDGGGSKVNLIDLSVPACPGSSCGVRAAFELDDEITALVADPSGKHLLAVTRNNVLYRWSVGDAAPTKLADGVTSAGWIPWS